METSFKQRCLEDWKEHHRKLLKTLQNEGPSALGDASESDYIRVEEWLKKILKGPDQNILKPLSWLAPMGSSHWGGRRRG